MSSRETLFLSAAAFLIFCPLSAVIFLPTCVAPIRSFFFFLHNQFRRFRRPSPPPPPHVIALLPHHPVVDTTRMRYIAAAAGSAVLPRLRSVFFSPPFSLLSYPRTRRIRTSMRFSPNNRDIVSPSAETCLEVRMRSPAPICRLWVWAYLCVCAVRIDLVG